MLGNWLYISKIMSIRKLHSGRAQLRNNSHFNPGLEPTQISLSLYVYGTSCVAILPPESKESVWEQVCGPLRWYLGSNSPLSHPEIGKPDDFHSQMLWGLPFLALEPWAGSSVWGWGHSLLQGYLCGQDIPPNVQLLHVSAGTACFMSPPLLLVSMWPLLCVLSYRSSVQLIFRWFSRLTVQ